MSDTTDPSKIASRALKLYIGRHDIPLKLMDRLPSQREPDQKLIDDIFSKFDDDLTSEARKLCPMRVILSTTNEHAINAISDGGDLSNFEFRFLVVDGQHRLLAALKFIEEAERLKRDVEPELLSWNCEVFQHELLKDPGLATLSVSYNSPGPSKKALAIDYLIAFTNLVSGAQAVNGRILFNRPKLSRSLISLHKSPTWAPFYEWARHPFNKWIGFEVLEGWSRYLTEQEILRLICDDSLAQIHRLEAIKIVTSSLTTADISGGEWTINTRNKTGTREAIEKHFRRRTASGIPFKLPGGEQMTTFEEFWSYAIEVDCIYGPALWISSDLDLTVKDKKRTSSLGARLVPRMRNALSLLSVLLFGREFTIDLKSDIPWWSAFCKKAEVTYQWEHCVEVLRMLAKVEDVEKVINGVPHVLAAEIGVEAVVWRLVWSEETVGEWDKILTTCEESLNVRRNDQAWNMIQQRDTLPATTSKGTARSILVMEKKLEDEKRKAAEMKKREAIHAEKSEKIRIRLKSLSVKIPAVGSAVPTTSSPLSKEKQKGRPWEESEPAGERSRKRLKYSVDGTRSTRPDISTSRSRSSSSPHRMPSGSRVGRASQHLSSVPSERSESPPDTSEPATRPDSGPDFMLMSGVEDEIVGTGENMESEEEGHAPMELSRHVLRGDDDDDDDEGEDEVEVEVEKQETMGVWKDSTPELPDPIILDSRGEAGDTVQAEEKRVWCLVDGPIPPPDIPTDPVPDPKKACLGEMIRSLVDIECLVDKLDDLSPALEDLRQSLTFLRAAQRRIRETTEKSSTTGRDDNQMQED